MDRILSKKAVVVGIFMLLVGVGSLLSASSSIDGVNHVITSEHLQKISHATTTSQTFTGELDDDCCGIIATGTCVKDNRSIFWKTRHSDDSSNKPYYNDDYTYTFYSCGPSDAHYKAGINEVGLALGSFTADSPGFISLANRQFNSSRTASPERCRRWALGHYSTVRDAAVYIAQNIEIEAGSGDNIGIVSAEFGVGAVVSSFNQSGYVYSHITWVNNTWQPIDNYLHCEGLHSDPDGTGDTVQAIWEDITDTGSTKSSDGDNKVTWKDVCHLGGKNVSGQEWGTGTIDTTDEISRSASVNTFVAVSGNNSYNGALNLAWIQMGRQALVGIFLPLAPSYLTSSSDIFHSWTDGNGMEDIMAPKVMYATGGGGFTSDSYDCSKTREILHYANNNENHTFDEYSTLMSSIMTSANENDAEAKMKYFVNENTETPLFYYIKNLTFGPVYNVEKNATYQSLQQAVDAADPGNTIKVLVNTTFNEHVIINKAITLIGKNNTKTIINGSSGTGSYDTIKITANNVTIKNFTIQGAYYAGVLLWTGVRDCRIENNIIANNYDGIELWESNINNTITGNSITNNAYRGVWLRSLDNNNTITGNTINSNSWSGIRAEGSSNNNTITNNVLSNNLCGISLYSINGTLVSYNTITYNTEDGMYLGSSNSNRIINNTISNNAYDGVYVFYDNSNNLITNCTIRYNGRTGIWLDHSNNNIIYNNYFNNTQNAYDNGTNKWNITKTLGINIFGGSYLGGNYWNDYIGGDIDADGLGDTFLPYNSSSKITTGGDYHPLAELDHAPSQPGNPFPPDQTTGVLITADLSWSATDSDLGDSITYDVYFGTAIPPPKVGAGNQTGTYDPGIMNFNTLYYWKIVAWDNHGASTAGPIWNFTTSINNPPNASGSPSPANSSTNVPIIQTLSWTGGDPDGDTVKYDVYFGMNTTPSMAVNNQSELSYGPLTLLYYKTYYWRIVAWDNHGASTNGSLWHFTTKRPTTVYVDDNFNENTPEWNSTRFASIQKGIDQVADGGTVFVWDGTYSELCSATSRSFNLTGNSSSTTFIKGAGSGTLLNLQSSQLVNISGFTIQNGGVGIGLDGCSYIHIINTVVTNNTNYGIYLHTSSYNNISGNNVSANKGQGIYLYDACSFNDLWSNTVQNNTNSGLYLFYASDNILHLNTANNNQVGIQVSNSQNNDLTGNIANNNAQHGIYIRYSGPDNYVIENTVNYNGQNGVYLDHSSNNNIFDNIVNDNTQNGVLLEYDSNSNDMSSSNTVNNNGIYGVYLRYCTGNMITQNTIQENQQYDLYVDGNDDSQFFHSITNNIGSGGRNIVYLMNFFNNYWTGTCSELFLYNADNSRFDYIICSGSDTKQNNGIIIRNTDLATFSHVTSST
ncbi:MAG: right-handed parallel beta-helix repeat-containing protein, partial [Euryarchaeota archaeon]|nr:right-handed parallel beta-helix repeat-containing protein [Euryarchaeota archaeon]